jgi:hypothetical protein
MTTITTPPRKKFVKKLTRKQVRASSLPECWSCGCTAGLQAPGSCRLFVCDCHRKGKV